MVNLKSPVFAGCVSVSSSFCSQCNFACFTPLHQCVKFPWTSNSVKCHPASSTFATLHSLDFPEHTTCTTVSLLHFLTLSHLSESEVFTLTSLLFIMFNKLPFIHSLLMSTSGSTSKTIYKLSQNNLATMDPADPDNLHHPLSRNPCGKAQTQATGG